MPRDNVGAVIPTKNVANIVRPTLDSLRFCDEVVVVDMFSTDDTREVCESYPNVRFLQREDYIYGKFNYGVDRLTTDWVIRLDSDEVISDRLRDSILAVLENNVAGFQAYEALCHLYFFGKRMHHGFGNHWRTVLFRRGFARYAVRSEHEGLTLEGPQGRLEGHYSHFTNPTISSWIAKLNYYSDRDVERDPNPTPASRSRVLYQTVRNFQRMYLRPYWLIRDGYFGFVVAGISAFAIFLQHAKAWEKSERLEELRARGEEAGGPSARALAVEPQAVSGEGNRSRG